MDNKKNLNSEKKFAAIGGQAVIEGVMMRSPNAFVVALRMTNGNILLRCDQWFGLSKKFKFLKKPFLRGMLMVAEAMINGIVALNFSANMAMKEELKKEALKKGLNEEKYLAKHKKGEKIGLATFLTMVVSFIFGIGLFIFLPHGLTILLGYENVESFQFHFVDGIVKSLIFILYIFLIGLIPDIKRIFAYHGAEHKAVFTFEAQEELTVEKAKKYTTLHPRCGTSFIFFLIFLSIIFFSVVFSSLSIGAGLPFVIRHVAIVFLKVLFMFPVAGISYEFIKYAGNHPNNIICKIFSFPGLMLQKITTREPQDDQLEVALASIKAVLFLEEHYNLKDASKRVLTLNEMEIKGIDDIELSDVKAKLKDFLE